jgi:NadR type nicotinamide-nucleotide adenylyltransferase
LSKGPKFTICPIPHTAHLIPLKTSAIKHKHTYRIAITGPESGGKSELAEKLASYYKSRWVAEYSREYLTAPVRKYDYDDILEIAKGQYRNEEELVKTAGQFLFCDTEFIVAKIWCEEKYGRCHPWILEMIEKHRYDLYLLCNTDLPWEYDPLRENPDDRERLFELYKKELEDRGFSFAIISGTGKERLENAVKAIKEYFS